MLMPNEVESAHSELIEMHFHFVYNVCECIFIRLKFITERLTKMCSLRVNVSCVWDHVHALFVVCLL